MVNIKNAHLETFPKNLRLDILALMTRGASNFFGVGGLKGVCTTSRPTARTKERLIFSERAGRTLVRRYVRPRDPRTSHQLPQRARFLDGNRLWSSITEEQRQGWQAYAERHRLYPRAYARQAGQRAYIAAAMLKTALDEPRRADPPGIAPPARPTSLRQEAATAPNELAFRLDHSIRGDLAGWRVKVEMSPATVRPTRKPRECDIVWSCGVSAASCPSLQPAGAVYRLPSVRFRLLPGQRYAVRVSLITPEGVRGAHLTGDFLRLPLRDPEITPEEILQTHTTRERSALSSCQPSGPLPHPLAPISYPQTLVQQEAPPSPASSRTGADFTRKAGSLPRTPG